VAIAPTQADHRADEGPSGGVSAFRRTGIARYAQRELIPADAKCSPMRLYVLHSRCSSGGPLHQPYPYRLIKMAEVRLNQERLRSLCYLGGQ
jgi:hypothetical protein